jgi:hypothetical protein
MRIALDATPLIVPTGGIRRYVEELVRALTVQFPHDSFQLISDQPNPPSGIFKYWWMLGANREMRRREIDLFHGTDFAVPYVPLRPSVLTLHDLSPVAVPGLPEGSVTNTVSSRIWNRNDRHYA